MQVGGGAEEIGANLIGETACGESGLSVHEAASIPEAVHNRGGLLRRLACRLRSQAHY